MVTHAPCRTNPTTENDSISRAKARLPLPRLLTEVYGVELRGNMCRCPLPGHEDRNPSFHVRCINGVWKWRCWSQCDDGRWHDEIDFVERQQGLAGADAVRRYVEMAGLAFTPQRATWEGVALARRPLQSTINHHLSTATTGPQLPADAGPGTEADWLALAALRHVARFAPWMAAHFLGTLRFGTVCGFPCWIITDERGLCAEARRMDGRMFPPVGDLKERKAHTLRGSSKSWPVGLAVRGHRLSEFRALLLVEGGPDYLAALHFTVAGEGDCLPIAFLGAGSGGAIHPEALTQLAGKRVRIMAHVDAAGRKAASGWAAQLRAAGAKVDAIDFAGLRKADGTPVNDLNDCTTIHPADAAELQGLLP